MENLQKRPKGFSSANSGDAHSLIVQLGLTEVDGNCEEPVNPPPSAPHITAFDFSLYPSEDAGIKEFMEYHQDQLSRQGAIFGRGNLAMFDIHENKHSNQWLIVSSTGQELSGTVDCCVAPYGLMPSSAANRAPVIFEHKRNDEQKEAYRKAHPTQPQVSLSSHCETCLRSLNSKCTACKPCLKDTPQLHLCTCIGCMQACRDAVRD